MKNHLDKAKQLLLLRTENPVVSYSLHLDNDRVDMRSRLEFPIPNEAGLFFLFFYVGCPGHEAGLFFFFFFLIYVGCPGQLTRTTTIPHGPLDILQAQEQVRHRGGNRRAHRGSNPGRERNKSHD
jgi:hypothetical protein